MYEVLSQLMGSLPAWLHALTLIVTAAAAITALTPTQADDAIVAKVLKVLDWLSLNFGNAGTHNGTVVDASKASLGLFDNGKPPKIKQ